MGDSLSMEQVRFVAALWLLLALVAVLLAGWLRIARKPPALNFLSVGLLQEAEGRLDFPTAKPL